MPTNVNSVYRSIDEFNELNLNKQSSFGIMHLNIASLNKYLDDLHNFLCSVHLPFKIIGISEHKIYINKTLNNNLKGYTFIFNNISSSHGGTGIFISEDLLYKRRNDLEICKKDKFESVFAEILFPGKKNIICGCIYRHPSMSVNEFVDDFLSETLTKINSENKKCIFMGDFNIDLLRSNTNNATSYFLDTLNSFFFIPQIIQPTRLAKTSKTLIDNIFFNSIEYETISGNFLVQIADHLIQYLVLKDFSFSTKKKPVKTYRRDFRFFNDNEFREELKLIEWKNILKLEDVNTDFKTFLDSIIYLLDEHAPVKQLTKKENSLKLKPWISPEIIHDMRKRDSLFRKYCQAKNETVKLQKFNEY